MSVHAECPLCRVKNSLRNKRCRCGEDLDKAKKNGRVKYWIAFRLPVDTADGETRLLQKWEYIGRSLDEAKAADGKRKGQKWENRVFEIVPATQMTFRDLAKWYCNLEVVKARRYFDTFQYYVATFNEKFGALPVRSIKTVDLENFQIELKRTPLSDSYVDHIIGAAKTIVYKAHENELLDIKTVMRFKKAPKLLRKGQNARKRILTPDQFSSLIAHLPLHIRQMLVLAFYTGMRRGEITHLRWDQVNSGQHFIELDPEDTKDKARRIIPFGVEVGRIFESITPPGPSDPDPDRYVFLYRKRPVKDIRSGLKSACLLAGIPYGQRVKGGFVFHDLRHTFNTYMRKAGVEPSVAKDITGHDTWDMFDWYNTIDEEDRKLAVKRFERYMKKQMDRARKTVKVDQSVDQRPETNDSDESSSSNNP